MMYAISTIKRKARDAGYSLREGYQRWHYPGWGYVRCSDGERVRGYEIFDYRIGCVLYCDNMHDYAMTFEEAYEVLKELCEAEGVKI